jgi:2-methylcitrate dehydratase PrpD
MTAAASLTRQLGELVAGMTVSVIPEEGRRIAKTGFADCIACMIAGSPEPVVGLVDRELAGEAGAGRAALIPSGERRGVQDAALVNGVAAHVLDYDDVALDGHPSAALVPAILAQAEASQSSGADMLAAYVAGYEAWAELLARIPGHLHEKGWHPTAVLGAVAAAAACARLRRLDATRTATAMAAAASMSAGLVANFGTMTKSFQVGRAAQSGVIAARLAAGGFTASLDVFEHQIGFLFSFAPTERKEPVRPLDAPTGKNGRDWQIVKQGLNVKRYPICYATHRSIDAIIDVVQANDLKPADVENVHVSTGRTQMLMLRNHQPQTGLEAKFSMEFAMASAVIARRVGLSELTDGFVQLPALQQAMGKVTYETGDTVAGAIPFAPFDRVEVTLKDGRKIKSAQIAHAKGSHERPLSADELQSKFDDCVAQTLPPSGRSRAFAAIMSLESAPSVEALALIRSRAA